MTLYLFAGETMEILKISRELDEGQTNLNYIQVKQVHLGTRCVVPVLDQEPVLNGV